MIILKTNLGLVNISHDYTRVSGVPGLHVGRCSPYAEARSSFSTSTMVKLKEIHRTSTFAWSPSPSLPLLATGTVAGALDESFSNNGQLEIWAPDFLDKNEYDLGAEGQAGPRASITTTSRFNRLAWGYTDGDWDRGVLVAGMENGELDIWDPSQILASAEYVFYPALYAYSFD